MLAARRGGADGAAIQNLLLAEGAGVDRAQHANGMTALHIAAWWGQEDAAACLLAAGANPVIVDMRGRTAAALAEERGHDTLAAMVRPPSWSPGVHHLWPQAFHAAARQVLLAHKRAAASLAVLPRKLLLHVLQAAAIPAQAWLL